MPESPEALEAAIRAATAPGFRDRLLARGEARAMVWREGELPQNAPAFAPLLSYDLLSYGYALLGQGIRLLDAGGSDELCRQAFEHAATAIEAVIARGPQSEDRAFHRVVAAACYHLGRFSARAYSLLLTAQDDLQTTVCEQCLILLMLRDLDGLAELVSARRAQNTASDGQLVETLQSLFEPSENGEPDDEAQAPDVIDVVDLALTDAFLGAVSSAMLAFERGDAPLLEQALARLQIGLQGAGELNMVPQWWCHRLAIHLLRGLWQASFHQALPPGPDGGQGGEWSRLRAMFIASLLRRRRSEIELWPSQLDAAARVLNTRESLVLSLPTGAGKTRIAELCILACLAEGRRVVFVTPLRALSAQTEAALERTFVPLGKSVSSLYGTTGVSSVDQDLLRQRDIIVATPEKLDFALRNDPGLLNDVGLVVLDEGHMIGDGEREVRYEVQVQRLLRRPDATDRRIICLSAILPRGEKVEDFVGWLTGDRPDGLITSDWRPTKLHFGEITWRGDHARLDFTDGDEPTFVPRFLEQSPPQGRRSTPFPKNQQELTLASAWRLVDDGQSVLIFCPLKASVNALAKLVVTLHRQGLLSSVFEGDVGQLSTALTIGREWFGNDHPVLKCLRLGVAIHHGSLPTPYRKEVERLLQQGALKITVSSPTLAQGLNLCASALIVHSIWRNKSVIPASEFRNIVGRAGRAYVDSVGIVLHPMYEKIDYARTNWRELVANTDLRNLQSGLMLLLVKLLARMQRKLGPNYADTLLEYIAGNAAWEFPEIPDEDQEKADKARREWRGQMASLDCALLSLLGEGEVAHEGIEEALDLVLSSSLWARSVARLDEPYQLALGESLAARARVLWTQATPAQRRGYYLAGVGLETGRQLDLHSAALNQHLYDAEVAIFTGHDHASIQALTNFAGIALTIHPFAPKEGLPSSWEAILADWLQGTPTVQMGSDPADTIEFIEETLAYRLPWALEAVRVRAAAGADPNEDPWTVATLELGLAVAAVEAGTLNRSAALLMRAGFPSRSGALAAVQGESEAFETLADLHRWLETDTVRRRAEDPNWPTPETHELWTDFLARSATSRTRRWTHIVQQATVTWLDGHVPQPGQPYRAVSMPDTHTALETADAHRVGLLDMALNPQRLGLLTATANSTSDTVELSYHGPSDLTDARTTS